MANSLIAVKKKVSNTEIIKRTSHTPAIVVKDALELTMPMTAEGDRYIALGTYRRTINLSDIPSTVTEESWSTYVFFRSFELSGIIYAKEYVGICGRIGRTWLPTETFEHFFVRHPRTRHWGLRMSSLTELWDVFGTLILENRAIAEQELKELDVSNEDYEEIEP